MPFHTVVRGRGAPGARKRPRSAVQSLALIPRKARLVSKRVPFGELDRTPRVTIIVNHILIHEGIEEVVMRLTPVLARERQARTARSTIVSSLSTFADYPVERLP